jgi:two-component system NtrC family sensor kinase
MGPFVRSADLFADAVRSNEEWLLRRVLRHALERGYAKRLPAGEEEWRASIRGFSSSFLEMAGREEDAGGESGPDGEDGSDPYAAASLLEAKKHRERGVPLRRFLGLMKCFRRSYEELVWEAGLPPGEREKNFFLVERFFDRLEIACCAEWTGTPENSLVADLQSRNRELVGEKNLFQSLIESLPDAAYLLDGRGTMRAVNPAGRELLRRFPQAPAAPPGGTLSGEPFPFFLEELKRFAASADAAMTFEKSLLLDGQEVHFNAHFVRWQDLHGGEAGVFATLADVSFRVCAQRELAAQHGELSRLLRLTGIAKQEWEGTMDCMAEMVVLTDEKFRIRRCNRAFQQFFGKEFQAILGSDCEEFLREKGLAIDLAGACDVEIRQADTGRWFHVLRYPFQGRSDTAGPLAGESLAGIVLTLHDVTEREQMVEELGAKNQKLAEAYDELTRTQAHILQQEKMASIGQLAAGVAHEINNPMGFIASNLHTLHKYVDRLARFVDLQASAMKEAGNTPEAVRKARAEYKIDRIRGDIEALVDESLEGAERVRQIVQNLKSFSRVDQAELKDVDINECVNSTINIVWNEIKYKATLDKDLGELPPTKCYPQQINQVLLNLLVNAAHAIEKQGEIRVASRVEDGHVCVSISDSGCGIPPEQLSRIFEPFFTTKDVGKGTGLGLSIAYDIVKKHNGEISVRSEVGKGSTFTVRIPLTEPRENA